MRAPTGWRARSVSSRTWRRLAAARLGPCPRPSGARPPVCDRWAERRAAPWRWASRADARCSAAADRSCRSCRRRSGTSRDPTKSPLTRQTTHFVCFLIRTFDVDQRSSLALTSWQSGTRDTMRYGHFGGEWKTWERKTSRDIKTYQYWLDAKCKLLCWQLPVDGEMWRDGTIQLVVLLPEHALLLAGRLGIRHHTAWHDTTRLQKLSICCITFWRSKRRRIYLLRAPSRFKLVRDMPPRLTAFSANIFLNVCV